MFYVEEQIMTIVPFHNDFPQRGEQPEQHNLAHKL